MVPRSRRAILPNASRRRYTGAEAHMPSVHEVKIELLTDEAFAPFGQIISAKDRAPDFQTASGTRGWAVDFAAGTPLLMLLHTPYQGRSFAKLERHFNL